jgi:hypothetical protein
MTGLTHHLVIRGAAQMLGFHTGMSPVGALRSSFCRRTRMVRLTQISAAAPWFSKLFRCYIFCL